MTDQLVLIDIESAAAAPEAAAVWHLDPATREIGRRGVARARAALRAGGPPARLADRWGAAPHQDLQNAA